jgi:hypothetical protein
LEISFVRRSRAWPQKKRQKARRRCLWDLASPLIFYLLGRPDCEAFKFLTSIVVPLTRLAMGDLLKLGTYAAPAFIVATTIPVVWKFAKNIRRPRQTKNEGLYEDRDGKATEESMTAYSTKKQFIVIFIGLGIGLLASLALVVNTFAQILEFHDPALILITFGCWVSHTFPPQVWKEFTHKR